jgi:hypothetical protein
LVVPAVGAPDIPNAWVLSSRIVDNAGHTPSAQVLHQFLATNCPDIVPKSVQGGGIAKAPPNPVAFQSCLTQLSAKYHLVIAYQPASRYWTFQWIELGIFLGAAVILSGFCFWWVRHRLS